MLMKVGTPATEFPVKASSLRAQVTALNGVRKQSRLMLVTSQLLTHTPSTAFWHPPPNSARFSYAAEGVFFISAQLSSDAVSALRKVRVLI